MALYYRSQWAQLAGHRVMMDLRSELYRHIQSLSHSFYQERQSGGIVSRLTADIALAQNFVGSAMTNIWMDLVTCAVYVYVLASMDGPLTLAALAVFPFYIGSMRWFGKRSKSTSLEVQEAMENFSGDVQERVAGFQLIKAFVAERREGLSFFRRSRKLLDLALQNAHITNLSNSVVQWLTQMATLGLVWYGGRRLMLGTISVGTVVAFILLVRELYFPINRISEMNTVLHNSLAATILAADRIVVLSEGRIVQVGSHAELARREGLYARLYEAQRLVAQNDVEPAALPQPARTSSRFGKAELR